MNKTECKIVKWEKDIKGSSVAIIIDNNFQLTIKYK